MRYFSVRDKSLARSLWDKWGLTLTVLVLMVLTELRTERRLFFFFSFSSSSFHKELSGTFSQVSIILGMDYFNLFEIIKGKRTVFAEEWTLVRSLSACFGMGC